MNSTVKPTAGLSKFLAGWPTSLFDRNFFDAEADFFPARLGVNVPSANFRETAKEYLVEIAAPGLERKDFNIELENHTLTISAEKEESKEEKEDNNGYFRKEYSFNSFCRSFALPENVKEGAIDAKYENGVLKLTVPKEKETPLKQVKKIAVS